MDIELAYLAGLACLSPQQVAIWCAAVSLCDICSSMRHLGMLYGRCSSIKRQKQCLFCRMSLYVHVHFNGERLLQSGES